MNLKLLLWLSLIALLAGCSVSKKTSATTNPQKDCQIVDAANECLIKKVSDQQSRTYARFYYDRLNNLISFADSQFDTAFVSYNQSSCLAEKIKFHSLDHNESYVKLAYNEKEQLISVSNYDLLTGNQLISIRQFNYLANGRLDYDVITDVETRDTVRNEYQYENENINRILCYDLIRGKKVLTASYVYEYDNFNNPYFHKRMPRRGRNFIEEPVYTLSKNNIISREKTKPDGQSTFFEKQYEYNEYGYPIQEIVGTTTFTYEYYCL